MFLYIQGKVGSFKSVGKLSQRVNQFSYPMMEREAHGISFIVLRKTDKREKRFSGMTLEDMDTRTDEPKQTPPWPWCFCSRHEQQASFTCSSIKIAGVF